MASCLVGGCDRAVSCRGWCITHYSQWQRGLEPYPTARRARPAEERFWEKVNQDGPISEHRPDLGPCWLWLAHIDRKGYGRFWCEGRWTFAHIVAHQWTVGPLGQGLERDHLCRNTACCNPAHLEAVTHAENLRRSISPRSSQTHCMRGHQFTDDNTYRPPKRPRSRLCRACMVHREQARAAARRKVA